MTDDTKTVVVPTTIEQKPAVAEKKEPEVKPLDVQLFEAKRYGKHYFGIKWKNPNDVKPAWITKYFVKEDDRANYAANLPDPLKAD